MIIVGNQSLEDYSTQTHCWLHPHRYLDKEKEQAGDSYIFRYSWGPRAKQEIDKRELLAMVAEVTTETLLILCHL